MHEPVVLVDSDRLLVDVAAAVAAVDRLALDVEGNGLFAYRPRLCTIQLAWQEDGRDRVAIIDTLAVDPSPLAGALGIAGPTKILHDLTFDARMLLACGIVLDRVEDTSVMARMLGRKATGLAALLSDEFGIELSKALQQHDWALRPISPEQIRYLVSDVCHLQPLATALLDQVRSLGIEDEVEDECAYKLECAKHSASHAIPPNSHIKGVEKLDLATRSRLRALVHAREVLAAHLDRPPFKVAPSTLLVEVARNRLCSAEQIDRLGSTFLSRHRGVLLDLFRIEEQSPPPPADEDDAPSVPDRSVLALRRTRQRRLSAWRRAEASARQVDEQVVLPGHCLQALTRLDPATPDEIARVPGIGKSRAARYRDTIAALLQDEQDEGER